MKDQLALDRAGDGGVRRAAVASARPLLRMAAGALLAVALLATGIVVATAQGGPRAGQSQGDLHRHGSGNGQTATPTPAPAVHTLAPQAPDDDTSGPATGSPNHSHHARTAAGSSASTSTATGAPGAVLPLTGGTASPAASGGTARASHPQASQQWPDIVLIPPAALPAAPPFHRVSGGLPALTVALLAVGVLALGGLIGLRIARRTD